MEILGQEQGWTGRVELLKPLQHRHRLSTSQPFGIKNSAQSVDEVPAGNPPLQPIGRLIEQGFHP